MPEMPYVTERQDLHSASKRGNLKYTLYSSLRQTSGRKTDIIFTLVERCTRDVRHHGPRPKFEKDYGMGGGG